MKKEELVGYIPYDVKALRPDNKTILTVHGIGGDTVVFLEDNIETFGSIDKCRLILRPLNDLNKPCLPDGKIPILELAKIAFPHCEDSFEYEPEKGRVMVSYYENGNSWIADYFKFNKKDGVFEILTIDDKYSSDSYQSELSYPKKQYVLFQKLHEYRFDINNLIEKGEAVDVNALDYDIYKLY